MGGRGSRSGAAGTRRTTAAQSRPRVTEQVAADTMSETERISWVQRVLPGSTWEEAEATANAADNYSKSAYYSIHRDSLGADSDTRDLLRLFASPNTPVYEGDIYRGVRFSSMDKLNEALSSGVWRETGITSFSSKRSVAESFAGDDVGLILTCKNNKTAMPFQHLSFYGAGEAEILSPGGARNVSWTLDLSSRRTVVKNGVPMVYIDMIEN